MKMVSSNLESKFEENIEKLQAEGYRIVPETFNIVVSPQGALTFFILMEAC